MGRSVVVIGIQAMKAGKIVDWLTDEVAGSAFSGWPQRWPYVSNRRRKDGTACDSTKNPA